jgi:hypothetical protein
LLAGKRSALRINKAKFVERPEHLGVFSGIDKKFGVLGV